MCSTTGDDVKGDGSEYAPFETLHRALESARKGRSTGTGTGAGNSTGKTIVLSPGNHYLGRNGTLELTALDSGLTITSSGGGKAWVSGGVHLTGLQWEKSTAG